MLTAILDALLVAAIFLQAALLGGNLYQAVVEVPNWRTPEGLVAYRSFLRRRHPGHYYQVAAPITVVTLLVVLIAQLATGGGRAGFVGAALGATVLAEVFTVTYFFPRNKRLLYAPDEAVPGPSSQKLVSEWSSANLVRVAIVAGGFLAGLFALRA